MLKVKKSSVKFFTFISFSLLIGDFIGSFSQLFSKLKLKDIISLSNLNISFELSRINSDNIANFND